MSKKPKALQDPFLNQLRCEQVSVSIFLVNGIKLPGKIESFDMYALKVRNDNGVQMVYKHAISSVLPVKKLAVPSVDHEQTSEDVQNVFLDAIKANKKLVHIYLLNGIKLKGSVFSHDQYSLLLEGDTIQLVYKHAISTISVPA